MFFNRNCEEFEKTVCWCWQCCTSSLVSLRSWVEKSQAAQAMGWWVMIYMQIIGGLILVLDKCLRNVLVGAKSFQDASTQHAINSYSFIHGMYWWPYHPCMVLLGFN